MSDADRRRALGDRAQALGKLEGNEGWELLRKELEERREAFEHTLGRRLLVGGLEADPVNQRQIDYQRGYWRGVRDILDSPKRAQEALADALKRMEDHA